MIFTEFIFIYYYNWWPPPSCSFSDEPLYPFFFFAAPLLFYRSSSLHGQYYQPLFCFYHRPVCLGDFFLPGLCRVRQHAWKTVRHRFFFYTTLLESDEVDVVVLRLRVVFCSFLISRLFACRIFVSRCVGIQFYGTFPDVKNIKTVKDSNSSQQLCFYFQQFFRGWC